MFSRRTLLLAAAPALISPAHARARVSATTTTTTNTTATCPQPAPPSAYTGLGDIYGPAIGYWGLRAFNRAYAASGGPAVQLQRASDNAIMDIHVLGNGLLDVATAANFLSGTNGGVSIWYDQSGHGYHHSQPDQSIQPQFAFNAIGSQPGVTFIANAGIFLEYAAGIPNTVAPVTFSHYMMPHMAAVRNINYMPIDSAAGGNQVYQVDGSGSINYFVFFSSSNSIPLSNNAWHSVQLQLSVGHNASNIYLDGEPNVETFAISSQTNILTGANAIGCDLSGPGGPYQSYFNGVMAEVAIFPAAATPAQMAAAASNQATYWSATAANQAT
jgi:hypothetical protein